MRLLKVIKKVNQSFHLKKGLKFTDALRLGYADAMREEVELTKNTLTAKDNVNTNLLL